MSTAKSLTFTGRQPAEGTRVGIGRAHGKAILLGEHAVVYGAPALAIPVPQLAATATATRRTDPGDSADRVSFAVSGSGGTSATPFGSADLEELVSVFKERTAVTERMSVNVLIDSAVPRGAGLGSSAACARAAVLALADLFDRRLDARAVFDLVQVSETLAHGRASGIDALAAGATSALYFRDGAARELPIAVADYAATNSRRWTSASDVHRPWGFDGIFVIADSGVAGNTKDAVELLRDRFQRAPQELDAFVRQVSSLTIGALYDLGRGRVADFGERLTENHRLLREIGISTGQIDSMVDAALAAGGLGAKVSGGGLGGCMIALAADLASAGAVAERLRTAGATRSWLVPVGRFATHGS
ncbi:mevalonate kinase [Asanoa ferruginea]|uniref:mevalonate kinase n=1 Tax=Asanoa ferruginea TaxID=53367 RepID=A0A3D9ZWS4_9ACTN|nr:mevalonate kinase [Asanoa ferruginea]REG01003.1 mevalonate kinase [Asanoa ferruginea]GIF47603.1 mevalonate kinase [Asanoa ferruginea]